MSSGHIAFNCPCSSRLYQEIPIKITDSERRALSSVLKGAREESGVRQKDLAELLEVPQSFVSKYESGERRLDLLEIRRICVALNIPLKDMVSRIEKQLERGK